MGASHENKPDPGELQRLWDDIDRYDTEHGNLAWFGHWLVGDLMEDPETEAKKIEAKITVNDLLERHGKLLQRLGLGLDSPNREEGTVENEKFAAGSMGIDLADKDRYLTFLRTVRSDDMTNAERELLSMVLNKVLRQLKNEYDLENGDERALELFSGMGGIIAEYERIGTAQEYVEELKRYKEFLGTGYLREYMLADAHGLLAKYGESRALVPDHRDISRETLHKIWNRNFFVVMEEVKKNPNAKDFYNGLLRDAVSCLDAAESDYLQNPSPYEGGDVFDADILKGIRELRERVSSMPEA